MNARGQFFFKKKLIKKKVSFPLGLDEIVFWLQQTLSFLVKFRTSFVQWILAENRFNENGIVESRNVRNSNPLKKSLVIYYLHYCNF